jgi:hypothetical protein
MFNLTSTSLQSSAVSFEIVRRLPSSCSGSTGGLLLQPATKKTQKTMARGPSAKPRFVDANSRIAVRIRPGIQPSSATLS